MPPFVALTLTIVVIFYGFVLERRRNPDVSLALWIPTIWIILIGTRFASQWLDIGGAPVSPEADLEGSSLDQAVFLGLYACAVWVLIQRRASLLVFLANNKWLTLFLIYCLVSVLWSDYPWTALKRWVKVTEHVAMVLVVLSEQNRAQAIDAVFRRFTYFGIALSVCFIKYFPEFGRGFSVWTGEAYNTGATTDKNALGHLCVIGGLLLVSTIFVKGASGAKGWWFDVAMLALTGWLLLIADAKTALVCFVVGAALVVFLARTSLGKHPKRIVIAFIAMATLAGVLQAAFDLRGRFIESLGREATLTDRTLVWEDVLAVENNAIVGTGFESFWLGERAGMLWAKYQWRPNQAHNGYIETYINLGGLGLILLLMAIFSAIAKALSGLAGSSAHAQIQLALLVAILLFNYTDATFKAVHVLYFVFFLIATAYPAGTMFGNQRDATKVPKPRRILAPIMRRQRLL